MRYVRGNFNAVFILFLSVLPYSLQGETLVMRGGLVFPRRHFPGPAYTRVLGPSLGLRDGNPVELDPLSRRGFHPLKVDPRTGVIEGAMKPSTVADFGDVLRDIGRADPESYPAVKRILQANSLPLEKPETRAFTGPRLADASGSIPGTRARAPHGREEVQPGKSGRPTAFQNLLDSKGRPSQRTCENLGDAICAGNDAGEIDRAAVSEQQQLDREFLKTVPGLTPELWKGEISQMLDLAQKIANNQAKKSSFKVSPNFEKYMDFLKERLPVDSFVKEFKEDTLKAIRAQPFDLGQKMAMERQLGKLEVGIGPDVNDMDSVINYLTSCGFNSPGGMAEVGKNRVVLCPFLIASAKGDPNRVRLVAEHELFHHLGGHAEPREGVAETFKDNFERLTSCFGKSSPNMTENREPEAIADHGAVEAIALRLEDRKVTGARALEELRTIGQPFCRNDPPPSSQTAQSDPHPPFLDRRRLILGRNDRILSLVCGPRTGENLVACTTEGAKAGGL